MKIKYIYNRKKLFSSTIVKIIKNSGIFIQNITLKYNKTKIAAVICLACRRSTTSSQTLTIIFFLIAIISHPQKNRRVREIFINLYLSIIKLLSVQLDEVEMYKINLKPTLHT